MTTQCKILVGLKMMGDIYTSKGKEYLTCDVNPFYNQPLKTVRNNLKYAYRCYPKVFNWFEKNYVEIYGKKPPKEWRNPRMLLKRIESRNYNKKG